MEGQPIWAPLALLIAGFLSAYVGRYGWEGVQKALGLVKKLPAVFHGGIVTIILSVVNVGLEAIGADVLASIDGLTPNIVASAFEAVVAMGVHALSAKKPTVVA